MGLAWTHGTPTQHNPHLEGLGEFEQTWGFALQFPVLSDFQKGEPAPQKIAGLVGFRAGMSYGIFFDELFGPVDSPHLPFRRGAWWMLAITCSLSLGDSVPMGFPRT